MSILTTTDHAHKMEGEKKHLSLFSKVDFTFKFLGAYYLKIYEKYIKNGLLSVIVFYSEEYSVAEISINLALY